MRPEVAKFLVDVDKAAALVEDFTRGQSLAECEANALLRSGVERQFIIMGEALMQASRLDPTLSHMRPALPQIVGFRNVLVHGYAVVQDRTVWGIVENDVARLRQEVRSPLPPATSP